jgi:general secretion pathway protein I
MSRARNDDGFSLVETLVALAVFAMAGVALVQLQAQSLSTFSRVETRALADIAAQNQLTRVLASQTPPRAGVNQQDISFAGRNWRMTTAIVATPVAQTSRVSVAVAPADGAPIATVHAFFVAPSATP